MICGCRSRGCSERDDYVFLVRIVHVLKLTKELPCIYRDRGCSEINNRFVAMRPPIKYVPS